MTRAPAGARNEAPAVTGGRVPVVPLPPIGAAEAVGTRVVPGAVISWLWAAADVWEAPPVSVAEDLPESLQFSSEKSPSACLRTLVRPEARV